MSGTNVWGAMPKSTTESTTIDEEIDAKLSAHNADPDAHAEAGQSLQVHRSDAIIDHLAGSVVTDKIASEAITSEKITSDQIIAKDIRTDEDVGIGVDGVKLDPNGIELWQSGEKTVDIPKTGTPYFKGLVESTGVVGSKFYLHDFLNSTLGWTLDSGVDYYESSWSFPSASSTSSYATSSRVGDGQYAYYPDVNMNPEARLIGQVDYTSGQDIFLNFFGEPFDSGFGFRFFNGHVYTQYTDAFGAISQNLLYSIPDLYPLRYGVKVITGVEFQWLVNDTVVRTKPWSEIGDFNGFTARLLYIYVKKTTSSARYFSLFDFDFKQDFEF